MLDRYVLPLVTVALFVVTPTLAQEEYETYYNSRFNYSISYPAQLFKPQGESANGDGQRFLSPDGRSELLVYGSNNALNDSLRQVYNEELSRNSKHPHRTVSYRVIKADWFVVSGTDGDRVFYRKTFLKNGVFKTFSIEYDKNQKDKLDSVTAKISASFKG